MQLHPSKIETNALMVELGAINVAIENNGNACMTNHVRRDAIRLELAKRAARPFYLIRFDLPQLAG